MAGDNPADVIVEQNAPDEARAPDASPPPASNSTLAMLSALQSGGDDPGKALFGALAGQAGGPNVEMLLKLLGGGDDAAQEQQREALREEIRAEQAEATAELADTAKRLFDECERGRARIESLAAALGACPVCFGEDLLCATCHGVGVPGGRAPDAQDFNRFVVPAVTRVREALRRAAVRRPWPSRPGTPAPSTAVTTAGAL